MARLVSLARAAKTIGIKRNMLQAQVRRGELPTFEGLIDLDLLQDVYPTVRMEGSMAVERARHIKETAFGRRVQDAALQEEEMLSTKVHNLQRDLDIERLKARRYEDMVRELGTELNRLQVSATREQSMTVACIKGWLRERLKSV